MEKMNSFKAAATIAAPVFLRKDETVEKVIQMAEKAAGEGARLIVFPETFIPCYPWWIWMGINNFKKGEFFAKLFKNSIEVPGKEITKICGVSNGCDGHVINYVTLRCRRSTREYTCRCV